LRNTLIIAKKEAKAYFSSPMAYVIGAVFLSLTGYMFVSSVSNPFPEATIRGWVVTSTFIFVLWSPVLTMRLLAEEQKLGTLELLMTSPVKDYEVVIGKYLATLLILSGTLFPTIWYVILLFWFGSPDLWPILTSYLGLMLFGGATLAIGLLASSLTSNQVLAAVMSFGLLLLLTLTNNAALVTIGLSATILEEVSLIAHFEDFARGIVDVGNVIYYLSVIAIFVFAAIRSLESRRWR
jgi:ABC-2 type transport system permease protein